MSYAHWNKIQLFSIVFISPPRIISLIVEFEALY